MFSPTLTSQTKVSWTKTANDQPLNGDPGPTLYMNPTTAVRLQGYRIAFPGYLPWNPGSAIPFGGPQKQLSFYQDFNWVKGRHDLRFGGYYMHMNDDRTFGAYANSVESLNTTSAALPSLDNFVRGQIRRFNGAINPNGFPGGTYTTPVGFPSFLSNNKYDEFALYANDTWSITDRLKLNLGLRYEYFGPQKKSEPKYDSNFYYSDDELLGEHEQPHGAHRLHPRAARPFRPTRARSARSGRTTGTTSPRASASRGTSAATARRPSAAATAWPTSATSAT